MLTGRLLLLFWDAAAAAAASAAAAISSSSTAAIFSRRRAWSLSSQIRSTRVRSGIDFFLGIFVEFI